MEFNNLGNPATRCWFNSIIKRGEIDLAQLVQEAFDAATVAGARNARTFAARHIADRLQDYLNASVRIPDDDAAYDETSKTFIRAVLVSAINDIDCLSVAKAILMKEQKWDPEEMSPNKGPA